MTVRKRVPEVIFRMRVRDESIEGNNPYRWEVMTSTDFFAGKRCVVFSLPGAFTPTCSTYQLPDFENLYEVFKALGIDEVYCISVNDAFVMNAWGRQQNLKNIKLLPDGSGHFTRQMGMLVNKDNLGFGMRSWRYAMLVDDGEILEFWEEPGYMDNAEDDPYGESSPQNVLNQLKMRDDVQPYLEQDMFIG